MESYYAGHRFIRSFKEIVLKVYEIIDSTIELRFGKYPDASNPIDYNLINRDKLFKDTGFECKISDKEAILLTMNWLRDHEQI